MLGHGFAAAGSTPCDHFYHPEERAANGGLTLIGVNTAAGAAKLIAAGYVRFTKVRIVDARCADGLARLPTGPPPAAGLTEAAAAAAQPAPPAIVHVPVPTPVTKEQLRSQAAPPIDSVLSLPAAYPAFHTGAGNVADKVVEEFEERLVDEKRMAVYPPLRILGNKEVLAKLKAASKFKNTLSTRCTMYFAIKSKPGSITDDKLADPKLTTTLLLKEARNHAKTFMGASGNKFDYYKASCDLYDNSSS